MFVSVSNEQPLGICAWVGVATVLAYARVIYHGICTCTYRVCMVYDHVYSMLLYKGILYLAIYRKTIQQLWLLSTIILILVIRRVPNHSLWTASFSLFKLSTCSSLLIGQGHSTWFGVQILTQLYIYSLYSIGGIEHLHVVLLGS